LTGSGPVLWCNVQLLVLVPALGWIGCAQDTAAGKALREKARAVAEQVAGILF